MDKRENLWKQYHKVKSEEDKSKILAEINDIQPQIRAKTIQGNINSFDKNFQKEKDDSRSL